MNYQGTRFGLAAVYTSHKDGFMRHCVAGSTAADCTLKVLVPQDCTPYGGWLLASWRDPAIDAALCQIQAFQQMQARLISGLPAAVPK